MVTMRTFSRSPFRSLHLPLFAAGALGALIGANAVAKKPKAAAPAAAAGEQLPIKAKDLFDSVQKLSGEEMSNRTPGSLGDSEARKYLAQQMSDAKLQPGGSPAASAAPAAPAAAAAPAAPAAPAADDDDGAPPAAVPVGSNPFMQPVPFTLVRTRLLPGGAPQFKSTAATVPVQMTTPINDVVLLTGDGKSATLRDSEVIFVGYGLTAPEYQWDDYKDADVQGKVVLILDGDPQSDAKIFAGKARTHYARWTHKFAQAASKGAAVALIVLDPKDSAAAGLNLNVLRAAYGNGVDYVLDRDPKAPEDALKIRGFLSEEVTRRVMQSARIEYDDLRKVAEGRDFRPVRPKLRMNATFNVDSRKAESANIVGVIPGSDPNLAKEAVVYTAHYDGQSATDSAAGAAALLAMARSAVSRGPLPRTQIFAALTAQTEYQLGARQLIEHLPAPAAKIFAHINVDGINPLAPEPNVIQIGRGKSTIDAILDAAAREQERKVVADPTPELGLYYRSESMAFARHNIPSVFLGWPDLPRYMKDEYRQGKEGVGAAWSFLGAAQDAELLLIVGRKLAEAKAAPTFKKTDEFAAK